MHQEIFRWMKDSPSIPFIGLSATPWARGLGKYYDDLIIAATTADLIRDGYLSPFVAFAPSEPDLAGVRTVAGDFHEGELADAMDRPVVTGDIVETWLRLGEGRPTLVYGVNRRHAQHVAERFVEAGVAAEYMDAFTDRPDRERVFDRLRAGSTKRHLQRRRPHDRRRPADGQLHRPRSADTEPSSLRPDDRSRPAHCRRQDHLLILDHAGNHLRLGMVTDIGQDHLDDGKERQSGGQRARERGESLPKLCEGCKAVVPRASKECPCCGSPIHARTDVEAIDGELVELGSRRSGAADH